MKKVSIFTILSVFVTMPLCAATVSRINIVGNQRMDAESIRILADVKVGNNVGDARSNEIAKKLEQSGYFSKISVNMSGNTLKIICGNLIIAFNSYHIDDWRLGHIDF